MADVVAFAREVAFDDAAAFLEERLDVADFHGEFVFLFRILFREVFADFARMHEDVVHATLSDVALDDRDEVFHVVPVGFAMLRHDVADVDHFGVGLLERFAHSGGEQVRYDARVEVARADDDVVGIEDGFARPRIELAVADEEGVFDGEVGVVFGDVDVGFADDGFAVFERHAQVHVTERYRDDLSADVEHFAEFLDARFEVAGDVGEGGEQEVANGVPAHAVAALEAVFEKLADGVGVLGEGEDGAADVARRQNAELVAEFAGRTAGVGHRYDGRQVEPFVLFQSGKDVEGSGASSDGRDVALHGCGFGGL